jgi:hypothetical protein
VSATPIASATYRGSPRLSRFGKRDTRGRPAEIGKQELLEIRLGERGAGGVAGGDGAQPRGARP